MSDPHQATDEVRCIEISEQEAGVRLDKVLADRFVDLSRSAIQRAIDEGKVWVDEQVASRKTKLRPGSYVHLMPMDPPLSEAIPENISLNIVFEDEWLAIIDKAAGMVMHPGAGHDRGTLVNAFLHHTGAGASQNVRPGIVHRIDKDTSGLIVIAKHDVAQQGLATQFAAHTITRRYLGIVHGVPRLEKRYETWHGRHSTDRKRFTSKREEGKKAITFVRRLEQFRSAASLVECRLETGRTHQIRVHLAEDGYPLLSDSLYGRLGKDPLLKRAEAQCPRQALHARCLGFTHPYTQEKLYFEAEPPDDFQSALEVLRKG